MTWQTSPTLFLAWQDPTSGIWFPIGKLTFDGEIYQFVYIRGATEASKEASFKPLASFPRLGEVYTSTSTSNTHSLNSLKSGVATSERDRLQRMPCALGTHPTKTRYSPLARVGVAVRQ